MFNSGYRSYLGLARVLFQHKVDVNSPGVHLLKPVMVAAKDGNPSMLDALIARGAIVNALSSDGQTALFYAVLDGSLRNVQALCAAGADKNIRDKNGKVAGQYAFNNGNGEIYSDIVNFLAQSACR
ncbi:MAG: ankyrin repeat domain-containing protein [Proteobacteria bacterium]|nr:ankyrin repeat domain-containing protein [Pseudomonadota bacterium]